MPKRSKPLDKTDHAVDRAEVCAETSISPIQQQAISLMMSGSNLSETARSVQISRGTLHYWLRRDPAFIAAYNGWRADLARSTRARLLALSDNAVKAITAAVEKGDAHLAFKVLKSLAILTPEPPGSDNPAVVEGQITLGEREERQVLGKRWWDVEMSRYIEWKPNNSQSAVKADDER